MACTSPCCLRLPFCLPPRWHHPAGDGAAEVFQAIVQAVVDERQHHGQQQQQLGPSGPGGNSVSSTLVRQGEGLEQGRAGSKPLALQSPEGPRWARHAAPGTTQAAPSEQPARQAGQRPASAYSDRTPDSGSATAASEHIRSASAQAGAVWGSGLAQPGSRPGSGGGAQITSARGRAGREYQFGVADFEGGVRRPSEEQPCCIS
jgi:hypothetical protein